MGNQKQRAKEMSYTAESGHWYKQSGEPCYTIEGKTGVRNTTLRDARKLNLVPSVTTVMNVQAKPALTNWLIDQALLSALTLPKVEGESLDEFKARAKSDSKEQVVEAADIGTQIHAAIECGFMGKAIDIQFLEAFNNVKAWLDAQYPGMRWNPEDSFCAPQGYGGKIDLYAGNVFVDFKSKDGIADKDPAKLVYDEHGMQLSAYANGIGVDDPVRISCFIDRKTLEPKFHVWDRESHRRHLGMFLHLLEFWKLQKNYSPEINK